MTPPRASRPPSAAGTAELETARLWLRLPLPDEAAAIVAYYQENEAHLRPWEPLRSPAFATLEAQQAVLARAAEDARADRHYRFWLFGKDAPERALGTIGISNVVRGVFHSAHLGFAIAAHAQGQGLMYEALEVVIPHAFQRLHLHRLEANYLPDNARSSGLLSRLGFERIGLARRYLRIAGEWRDHVQTQRLNDSWTPP